MFGETFRILKEGELDKIRAKVGFLFQSNALYDSMTVSENREFPLRRHWLEVAPPEVNEMVMKALGDVGLKHTVDIMPSELSDGMRKQGGNNLKLSIFVLSGILFLVLLLYMIWEKQKFIWVKLSAQCKVRKCASSSKW